MGKKALIVWGGWDGHQPEQCAAIFARELKANGFEVELANTLDAFRDKEKLLQLNLIVPHWTMGQITGEQRNPVLEAVQSGVGLAGCHGGMCDAFRNDCEWQMLTGGQFVGHPGNGINYRVQIAGTHFITEGQQDFDVHSEQYYMHVDPSNEVLAYTIPAADGPHQANSPIKMPVTWTRKWGAGRVAYCSLGHDAKLIEQPPVLKMIVRCMLWAAK
jgi:uncharacterized protein